MLFESDFEIVYLPGLQWMTSAWKLMEKLLCRIRNLLDFFRRRPVTIAI